MIRPRLRAPHFPVPYRTGHSKWFGETHLSHHHDIRCSMMLLFDDFLGTSVVVDVISNSDDWSIRVSRCSCLSLCCCEFTCLKVCHDVRQLNYMLCGGLRVDWGRWCPLKIRYHGIDMVNPWRVTVNQTRRYLFVCMIKTKMYATSLTQDRSCHARLVCCSFG